MVGLGADQICTLYGERSVVDPLQPKPLQGTIVDFSLSSPSLLSSICILYCDLTVVKVTAAVGFSETARPPGTSIHVGEHYVVVPR